MSPLFVAVPHYYAQAPHVDLASFPPDSITNVPASCFSLSKYLIGSSLMQNVLTDSFFLNPTLLITFQSKTHTNIHKRVQFHRKNNELQVTCTESA
jgi:hypothetical protein